MNNALLKDGGHALKRVREDRRFAPAAVARATGILEARLDAFENGRADPTPRQLEALARIYGVRPYQLRAGLLPNTPPMPIDFRGRTETKAALSVNGYKAYLFGQRISAFAKSVTSCPATTLDFEPIDLPAYPDPTSLADAIRDHFAFDVYKFLELKSPAKAYRHLRAKTELSGVSVLTTWYEHNDFRGFYTRYLSSIPTIMIHTRGWDVKSRLFTLAHELCHHLLGREGISDPLHSENATEAFCNKFAAALLGPVGTIDYAIAHTATPKSDIYGFVRNVAAKTLLSQYATAIRLKELKYITGREFDAWKSDRVTFGDAKKGYAVDGEPPDEAERTLPRYGYLTALAIGDAVASQIADPVEVESATGIKTALQRPLAQEALEQIEALGIPR